MSSTGASQAELTSPASPPRPPKVFRSLSDALSGTANSLGLIRLVLAALVIFDHGFPLGGFGHDPFIDFTNGQVTLGTLAVVGFFAISGYLIAKSGTSGDVVQFMWRRTLRIFPAYWLVLLVTGILVAPVIWVLEGHELLAYFAQTNWGLFYFRANWTLTIHSYGILDLLVETTPYGREIGASAFNGSIWTLIYEWNCYLIIGVLVAFGVLRNAKILVPILTTLFLLLQVIAIVDFNAVGLLIPRLADPYMLSLGLAFLIGSTLAVYSKSIPYDDRLGILAGIVMLVSLRFGGFSTVGTAAGAYFVMYLAARLPKQVQWIGAKNDYSYGVYIYGFLVQQVLAFAGVHKLGYVPFVAAALVITLGCAWISWHLVEKRAMALKNWGPGQGWQYWYERARSRVTRSRGRKPQ